MRQLKTTWLFFGLATVALLVTFFYYSTHALTVKKIAVNLSESLKKIKADCDETNQQLINSAGKSVNKNYNQTYSSYIFRNDSLIDWISVEPESFLTAKIFDKEQSVIKLKSAYYIYFKKSNQNYTSVCISKIKSNYSLQNNFLQNNFAPWLNVPKGIDIEFKLNKEYEVSLNNVALFSLTGTENTYLSDDAANSCTLFFYIFLFFFSSCIFN